jgi:hypothetical protein
MYLITSISRIPSLRKYASEIRSIFKTKYEKYKFHARFQIIYIIFTLLVNSYTKMRVWIEDIFSFLF